MLLYKRIHVRIQGGGGGVMAGGRISALLLYGIVIILTLTFDSSHIRDSKLSISTHHA